MISQSIGIMHQSIGKPKNNWLTSLKRATCRDQPWWGVEWPLVSLPRNLGDLVIKNFKAHRLETLDRKWDPLEYLTTLNTQMDMIFGTWTFHATWSLDTPIFFLETSFINYCLANIHEYH